MKRLMTVGAALLGLCVATANASTIVDGFALVVDGVPNSPTDEISYLNMAINAWNTGQASNTPLGTETYWRIGAGTSVLDPVSPEISFNKNPYPTDNLVTVDGTVRYIVTHWGGSGGGMDIMYYVLGQSGTLELSTDNLPAGISLGGISSVTTVGGNVLDPPGGGRVPDSTATLGLFGLGLCGMCSFARYQRKTAGIRQ